MSVAPTLLLAVALVAAPEATERKLTFDEAIELVLEHPEHRGLSEALSARRSADGEISSLAHDPSLLVMPGYRSNPAASAGLEAQVTLSQSWSLAGLGARRKDAAEAERDVISASLRADALARRLLAARAWIELRLGEEDARRVATATALAADLEAKLAAAAGAGVVLRADLVEARAFLAETRAAEVDAEGHVAHARFELADALGLDGTKALATDGPYPRPELPEPGAWPGWVARASRLPSAEQAELTSLAARAQAVEAAAQGGWTLQTQVSFQKESPTSYISWLGLGVTMPVFDGERRARSVAESARIQAEARRAAAAKDAGRTVALALHEVAHGRERLTVVSDALLPALEELVELRARAFEAGEGTALELLRAKQRLLATQRAREDARAELRWSEVQAWLLLAAIEGGAPIARRGERTQ